MTTYPAPSFRNSLDDATDLMRLFNSHMSRNTPIRYQRVVVDGPCDNFAVMALGEAQASGFVIIC